MTRERWIAAGLVLALLASLLGWQIVREREIAECHAYGGVWSGRSCGPSPRPIDLRRGIERT